jgi:hypothetical protein
LAVSSLALGVAFASPLGVIATQETTLSAMDAAAIDAALRATAVPKIQAPARQAAPKLLVADMSLSVCDRTPKTFCLDSALKTLSVVIARNPPSLWSAELTDAVKSRNAGRQSIARLKLSAATIVSAETTSTTREGRAVVRASLPGYASDRAVVILQLSYGASTIWAVLLQRNGDAWRVLDERQLGQS